MLLQRKPALLSLDKRCAVPKPRIFSGLKVDDTAVVLLYITIVSMQPWFRVISFGKGISCSI